MIREELVFRKQTILEEIVKELRTFVFLQSQMGSEFNEPSPSRAQNSSKAVSEPGEEDSISELDSGSLRLENSLVFVIFVE